MQPARIIPGPPDTLFCHPLPAQCLLRCFALLTLGLLLGLSLLVGLIPRPVDAQSPAPQTAAAASDLLKPELIKPDLIKQRQDELEATRAQQKSAAEAEQKLRSEIATLGQDRSKLNQQLIDSAAQVRGVESRISDAEARLRPLDAREQQIRGSLDSRQLEVVEVLAALQRAGRRTPPALLVRPDDALQSLRTALLLGSVVPELRSRAEQLATDLGELVSLRRTIASERDQLAADRDRFKTDQARLAALIDERQRQQSSIEKDMEAEGARAIALSKQVDSLQGLIAKLEQDSKAAAKAAVAASLESPAAPGSTAPVSGKSESGALKDPARLSPAIAFASAKGLFTLPVNGVKIRGFGGSDGAGGIEKGISLVTRAGAQVTTPCDGWVVYAGPFRSYGQLLILNAGGGYHVLIAGMGHISVNIGQFVLTGEPVATMGSTSQVASLLATNASQPVLYVEFRKDGTPIDPGPWWAASEGEKVRG
jgi:septal ring factor EnvC (AmiA/AmiB activator)